MFLHDSDADKNSSTTGHPEIGANRWLVKRVPTKRKCNAELIELDFKMTTLPEKESWKCKMVTWMTMFFNRNRKAILHFHDYSGRVKHPRLNLETPTPCRNLTLTPLTDASAHALCHVPLSIPSMPLAQVTSSKISCSAVSCLSVQEKYMDPANMEVHTKPRRRLSSLNKLLGAKPEHWDVIQVDGREHQCKN